MTTKPELLYLDLMKKALSFTIWPEPPREIKSQQPGVKQGVFLLNRLLQAADLVLSKKSRVTEADREEGKFWPAYAHTMTGLKRLNNIQECVENVLRNNIEGDFIETGVWRGGTCIFMRAILAAYGIENRKVFVADSFEGLPRPSPEKFIEDKDDDLYKFSELAVSQEEVAGNFEKYGLLDDQVVFLKGWFRDTLPTAPIEKLAILRLDGDMYESTMDALDNLYPKLSPGGFCIIDDYALPMCAKAVNDYRKEHGIGAELHVVDWTGRYWIKD